MVLNNRIISARNSSIELVRLLAMFMIVFYHIVLFFIEPIDANPIYKAIQIPLHIGVMLFVLISGYFGIKPSFLRFFKILCVVAVYFLPLRLWYVYKMGMGGMAMLDSFHILSKTPYWFVRTYLCLYLISPLLNKCLKDISIIERSYYIFAFAIIAVYLGILQCDISLIDGKNLANFMLIYIIGDTIRQEQQRWKVVPNWCFFFAFILLNLLLSTSYVLFSDLLISDIIWNWSFPYYSPFLIISSVLFFIPFTRFSFYSPVINYIASSVFSVYILHHQPTILEVCLKPVSLWLYGFAEGSVFLVLLIVSIYSMIIIGICVIIDKLLTPIWIFLQRLGQNIDNIVFNQMN
ncbi:MAG: acyltransferase family protein [Bacilli bacterium]|nr:acyltransferase family protein [Prevotella sp.]MBR0440135.1 acyltransferase family protein [Bacilli bacterium]